MKSGLYQKYISKSDPFDKEFNKLQKINKTKDVVLDTVKSKKYMMPKNNLTTGKPYKVGDAVDENDFENAFSMEGSDFPQLSVEDYSYIKQTPKGKNFVTKLN